MGDGTAAVQDSDSRCCNAIAVENSAKCIVTL